MQYAKCKCGKRERWDSGYPIYPCQGCEDCQTTLARGPSGHLPLVPHKMQRHEEKRIIDGKEKYSRIWDGCSVCGDTEEAKPEHPVIDSEG